MQKLIDLITSHKQEESLIFYQKNRKKIKINNTFDNADNNLLMLVLNRLNTNINTSNYALALLLIEDNINLLHQNFYLKTPFYCAIQDLELDHLKYVESNNIAKLLLDKGVKINNYLKTLNKNNKYEVIEYSFQYLTINDFNDFDQEITKNHVLYSKYKIYKDKLTLNELSLLNKSRKIINNKL